MPSARKRTTIRFQLTCLVLACVLPVWLIAGALVWYAYTSKLEGLHRSMLASARIMGMVVDRELTSMQSALLALATSPSFAKGDFADIHRQTHELLQAYPGCDIIVADSSGQQLVNSFRPFGTPLPKRANQELVKAIFATGRPVISNLFFGAVTKRPMIAIDVPVFVNGTVRYDLSLAFPSERMTALLRNQSLPDGRYCTVLDRNHVIVARTSQPERFVGTKAGPDFRRAARAGVETGTGEVKNVAGITVLVAFSRSLMSGWILSFGVPMSQVMADMYRWVALAAGGATLLSLVGILLATAIARRIAGDIQSLVAPALAIGAGEVVGAVADQTVKETAEVADALVQASNLLRERAQERDLAEQRLSRSIEDLNRETSEKLRTLEELRRQERMLIQQSRQAAMGEMIGNIAHQWRQPLNSLSLLVQKPSLFLALDETDQLFLEENTRKSLEVIKHMSRTIDDFRNFFRPNKDKVTFRVGDEVSRTLSLMEGTLQGQQIHVQVVANRDSLVSGYPNEFSQVLLNILVNARDAVKERGIRDPRVVITLDAEEGRSVVTVADNAGGIPDEIMAKIFDPYFTTKGPQLGTGVGLFMSKTIIEKNMGGRLTARNNGNGAEFRIEV
ncbi:hypothetical protein GMSM_42990 [Geomonas sp. Red276]